MKKSIVLTIMFLALGCSGDNFPSYEPINNTLPNSGIKINYDENSSLTNIQEIQEQFDSKNSEVFMKSLTWYGTEANYGFNYIHGKTAKELVDIVNCLKTSNISKQEKCFK